MACTKPVLPPTPLMPTPAPAEFKVISLDIVPPEARVGETVNINIQVKNIGEAAGTYVANLMINGVKEQTTVADVAPGDTKTITFSMAKEQAGTYNVEMGGLTSALIVKSASIPAYSNPQTYRVVRTVTIQNDTAGVDLLRIWMPAVIEWDSQRSVVTENVEPPSNNMWKDPQFGSRILFWEIAGKPAAGSSLTITDQFNYTCYDVNYTIEPEQITTYDRSNPEYLLYIHPEKYLEADDPNLTKTAKEIMGNKTNPYDIARNIYRWVIDHMSYRNLTGLSGAKFAFENRYGNCGDYSALFVTLCRSSSIPARPVVGRWATSAKDDWHVWAEFYLPGYGWVPVDPAAEGLWGGNYFGHIDNKRLIFNKQYNIVLHPSPYLYPSEQSILQLWFWEYEGFPGTISADIDYSISPISGN
jgi:transglutaminase-like putative cysteine protease